jgi:hypothetical protein
MLKRSPRRKLLNEYARHLVKYHPNLKNEVLIRLQHLNKQWKSIELTIFSKYFDDKNILDGKPNILTHNHTHTHLMMFFF